MASGVFNVRGRPAVLITLLLMAVLVAAGCRRDRDGDSEGAATTEPSAPATATTDGGETLSVPRPEAGESRGSMQFAGRERKWRLYVPESLASSGDVPLVLGLHGGLGSGEQFAADGNFDEQAERGGVIAVYPDGVERRVVAARTWNGGGCCGYAMEEEVDDVGFLAALIEELSAELPIDRGRIYATGHSNGAMMSYRLACERADLITAIAVYAGALEAECAPSEPVSVLAIHGTADQHVPIGGGVGPKAITDTDYHSLDYSIGEWLRVNGCSGESTSGRGKLKTTRWEDCDGGVVVEMQVLSGASHSWPGGAPTGPLRPNPSQDLDASAAVWDFLSLQVR